jgi:signal transduction histidine kinase
MQKVETRPDVTFRERLFAGGGETGALMLAMDWSATPLGPPESWSQALRSIVRVLLTSRYAMWMGWGPEGIFLYNDAYAAMTLGAKHPWALGKPSSLVWAEIWPQIGPRIERVLATGEATWDEGLLLFLERNGYKEETYHTFSYSPLSDDDGTVRGHLCVVIEETERIVGARRLEVLKELASQLASTNRVDDVFQASERCLSVDSRDLPFSLIYRFDGRRALLVSRTNVPPGDSAAPELVGIDQLEKIWGVNFQTPTASLQVAAAHLPASWGSSNSQVSSIFAVPIVEQAHTSPTGVLIAGVNPFRRPDESYRTFVCLFVGQIAAGLANARAYEETRQRAEALAELDRAKTLFFTNVSHEFRTPLTLILGPLQDLLAGSPRLTQDQQEKLAIAQRNGMRLLKLVNTLLDFSRMESGRAQARYEATDLAAVTRDLAASFRSLVEKAGMTLEVQCESLVQPAYVDREMWEKIVLNLISNAFKFTFSGQISVHLRQAGARIELAVKDTGTGIPETELSKIFDRFHRVEGTQSRTYEGSGIGLALVNELVKMHGGEVRVASQVGVGSTFTVSIPIGNAHLPKDRIQAARNRIASAGNAAPFVAEASRWGSDSNVAPRQIHRESLRTSDPPDDETVFSEADRGARILLADDNADMREYVRHLLEPHYVVDTVADGAQALRAARANRPDLLLTDVMMPNLDGFGLLSAMRADPELKTVPILVLSARAGQESRVDGLRRGADDYLIKPFSARELLARIRSLLELYRMRVRAAEERELLLAREREARLEAEEAHRAKDEFLALLGHELRNPLAPIFTALQLMRLRKRESTERERTVIERQVNHLTRLVDDLLDISRIKRGNVQLKKNSLEIATVVAKAIEMASPLIEERMHYLSVEVPNVGLMVEADSARLTQAIANLLTNAAKYTEPRGSISITGLREGEDVVLRVKDTGIGMSEESVSRVFDLFYQDTRKLDRSQGGLGIGLTIVRSLVTLHGGTVQALSEGPGKGSEFLIRVPAAKNQSTIEKLTEPHPLDVAQAADGIRVLIVDDNEDAATLLSEALEATGHVTRTAFDPLSALELAPTFKPDVILLDIGLPVMDGYELAQKIRQIPELRAARLFALTGYGQESDRARSRRVGFERHLTKPIDLHELKDLIRASADTLNAS